MLQLAGNKYENQLYEGRSPDWISCDVFVVYSQFHCFEKLVGRPSTAGNRTTKSGFEHKLMQVIFQKKELESEPKTSILL